MVSIAVVMHRDRHLLDYLDGHLFDGGDWHLDFLNDGDVVFNRVLFHDGYIYRLMYCIWGGHGQRYLVNHVLSLARTETAAGGMTPVV